MLEAYTNAIMKVRAQNLDRTQTELMVIYEEIDVQKTKNQIVTT